MSGQTVTRAIEAEVEPRLIYSKLADVFLLPQWAPVFADKVEPNGKTFRISKSGAQFDIDLVLNEQALTVDYLRPMEGGKRGGAYIRVMPRPVSGCVVVMTVPLAPGTTVEQVASVLEQELQALLKLA